MESKLQAWLALPHVHIAQPSKYTLLQGFEAELWRLLRGRPATSPPMSTSGCPRDGARVCLYSTDADFARFSGLRRVDPGAPKAVGLRRVGSRTGDCTSGFATD